MYFLPVRQKGMIFYSFIPDSFCCVVCVCVCVCVCVRERERERETDRQTDRQPASLGENRSVPLTEQSGIARLTTS